MKILISGGTGFVGKHLIKRLIREKITPVVIIRPTSDKSFLAKNKVACFVFKNNTKSFTEFVKKEKFNGVIHLASLFLKEHEAGDISKLIGSNITFSTQLLQVAAEAGIPWFINTGTFWQHYQNKDYSPVNLYAATKQAFEILAKFYQETSKINFVTIKLNDTFGSNDSRPKILNLWHKISKNQESLDMSPGKQLMDISYIDNVIDAYFQMMRLLEKDKKRIYQGKSFAVRAAQRMTLRQLSKIFERAINTKLKINWGKREYGDREIMIPWNKGKTVPGWRPKISLFTGIKRTFRSQ